MRFASAESGWFASHSSRTARASRLRPLDSSALARKRRGSALAVVDGPGLGGATCLARLAGVHRGGRPGLERAGDRSGARGRRCARRRGGVFASCGISMLAAMREARTSRLLGFFASGCGTHVVAASSLSRGARLAGGRRLGGLGDRDGRGGSASAWRRGRRRCGGERRGGLGLRGRLGRRARSAFASRAPSPRVRVRARVGSSPTFSVATLATGSLRAEDAVAMDAALEARRPRSAPSTRRRAAPTRRRARDLPAVRRGERVLERLAHRERGREAIFLRLRERLHDDAPRARRG